jgi:hypothetical protein
MPDVAAGENETETGRREPRAHRPRAFVNSVPMPLSNQINRMKSQAIHVILLLFGPTLRSLLLLEERGCSLGSTRRSSLL